MLAIGGGFTPHKPQPSHSYSAMAPSGPYASPTNPVQSFASPHPNPVQMRGPQPGSLAVPYGFDPLSQSGQNIQAPPPGFVPHGGQSGADLLALAMRKQLGVKRSFGYGTKGEQGGDILNLMGLIPGPQQGELAAAKAPGLLARLMGRGAPAESSAVSRIIGGSSAPVQNPQLLGRLGEHADLAEKVLANKAFDQVLAQQSRQDMLSQYSLGQLLRGETPPSLGVKFGFERRKFPR